MLTPSICVVSGILAHFFHQGEEYIFLEFSQQVAENVLPTSSSSSSTQACFLFCHTPFFGTILHGANITYFVFSMPVHGQFLQFFGITLILLQCIYLTKKTSICLTATLQIRTVSIQAFNTLLDNFFLMLYFMAYT